MEPPRGLLKFVRPPEAFTESFEFDHEIERGEPLLFTLRRFLEQFPFDLSRIYLIARELTMRPPFQFLGRFVLAGCMHNNR
jgi:hypothetical protein